VLHAHSEAQAWDSHVSVACPNKTPDTCETKIGGSMSQCKDWYALQVRQQKEKFTAILLGQKGYETFLPTYLLKRRWSDRVKVLEMPLFAGYLFCRLDLRDVRLPVVMTPGVVSIVSFGSEPIAIPEAEINAVMQVVRSTMSAEPWPYISCGDEVTISAGPLRGVRGILTTTKSDCRVVISITLLQRSVAVTVDRRDVLPSSVYSHLPGILTTR